jgi:23S rRNA (cytosine1962-C5)-methyltransferase
MNISTFNNFDRIDYELLDFGGGSRLERFGQYIIERPSLAADEVCRADNKLWNNIDSLFIPESSDTQRGKWTVEIDSWQIQVGQVTLELQCTPFGHVGFFAEQITNWLKLSAAISESLKQRDIVKVLNLFAYTGGASIAASKVETIDNINNSHYEFRQRKSVKACLPLDKQTTPTENSSVNNLKLSADNYQNSYQNNNQKKVEVTHVDSASNVVKWAKRNAELSNAKGIRFIVDDVRKFVLRELRRGNCYDAIILDPPTYGHGTRGESWKLAADLPKLLSDVTALLSKKPILILLTAHAEGFNHEDLQKMLKQANVPRSLNVKNFQMQIKAKTGKSLHSGYGVIASEYNL